jgi:hypothetical protein
MTRRIGESVIVRTLVLKERHDTTPCIVLTHLACGSVRMKLILTTFGGSRSDSLALEESEESLASLASSISLLDPRFLGLSVLNGFPDTIALSNFCTSSEEDIGSIPLHLPGVLELRTEFLC